MEKEYLRETYKEFSGCYSDDDFIRKADDLNTSREVYYDGEHGIGTFDIEDVLPKDFKGENLTLDGHINIEVHEGKYVTSLEIPCEIYCEEWDEEDQIFGMESVSIKEVEEW